jgi:hypothetical protein
MELQPHGAHLIQDAQILCILQPLKHLPILSNGG